MKYTTAALLTVALGACSVPAQHTKPQTPQVSPEQACLMEAFKSYHWQGDGKIDEPYCQSISPKQKAGVEDVIQTLRLSYQLQHEVQGLEAEFTQAPQAFFKIGIKLPVLQQAAARFEQLYPQANKPYVTHLKEVEETAKEVAIEQSKIKDQLLSGAGVYSDLREAWYTGSLSEEFVGSLDQRLQGVKDAIDTVHAIHTLNSVLDLYRATIQLDIENHRKNGGIGPAEFL